MSEQHYFQLGMQIKYLEKVFIKYFWLRCNLIGNAG